MNKGIIVGGVVAAIVIGILVSYYGNESAITAANLDVERKHGTVDTSMGSPILGSPNAPITIVEFGDYQCPQCNNWYHNTKPSIQENLIDTGKANLVFVDLAFFGQDSINAAQASYCAEEQGKYWEYHDQLYMNQKGINDGWANPTNLKTFALNLDLDMELFETCLDSGKYQKRVKHNVKVAGENGATSTPTFIIVGSDGNQQKISGAQPFTVFKQTIDQM